MQKPASTLHGSPRAIFDEHESAVRTYCRKFPAVFSRALGHRIWDEEGREYTDFLSGAGALNYGHNHPAIKRQVIEYLEQDGITHSMDLHTQAKRDFMQALVDVILKPRKLDYRIQFTGPTGSNAVEGALKIVRKATGRASVIAFTNGFHGMSLGALAATGTAMKRAGAGLPLAHVTRMPFDGYFGEGRDTLEYVEALLDDPGSGVELPAAFILETVQGEGGVIAASKGWLQRLQALARRKGILLIVDDIQAGCGRTGTFFSFEEAGLTPDVVTLSKSIGGLGLPMALVLVKPELDVQQPGEHSGTFRGNNLAFVAARAALSFWADPLFEKELQLRCALVDERLRGIARQDAAKGCTPRGRGLLRGLTWADPGVAGRVSQAAFQRGLIAETSGAHGHVLKVMPPLTIDIEALRKGLDLLADAIPAAHATV